MPLGPDVFGYVAGAFGIIGLFYTIIQSQRPKYKMKGLDEIIKETEDIFYRASEDGLLINPLYVTHVRDELFNFHIEREDLRTRTYCAESLLAEVIEMIQGLSRAISIVCSEVSKLRADILTKSQAQRLRLLEAGQLTRHPQFSRTIPDEQSVPLDSLSDIALNSTSIRSAAALLKIRSKLVESSTQAPSLRRMMRNVRHRSRSCPPNDLEDQVSLTPDFISYMENAMAFKLMDKSAVANWAQSSNSSDSMTSTNTDRQEDEFQVFYGPPTHPSMFGMTIRPASETVMPP